MSVTLKSLPEASLSTLDPLARSPILRDISQDLDDPPRLAKRQSQPFFFVVSMPLIKDLPKKNEQILLRLHLTSDECGNDLADSPESPCSPVSLGVGPLT